MKILLGKLIILIAAVWLRGSTAGADGVSESIVVQQGDSLSSLAEKHLGDSNKWRIWLRFNNIDDPNLIYPGTVLKYSNAIKEGRLAQVKVLFATEGQVKSVAAGSDKEIRTGETIPAMGIVSVQRGSATLVLPDSSKIFLDADSSIRIVEVLENKERNTFLSYFESLLGRTRFKVQELFQDSRFEVRTKSAVAGVRGTEFEIVVEKDETVKIATLEGAVSVKGDNDKEPVLVEAGSGAVVDPAQERIEAITQLVSAPANISYQRLEDKSLRFLWEAVKNAIAYSVYISPDRDFVEGVLIGKTEKTSMRIRGVPPGKYYLRVDAIDAAGMSSMQATPVLMLLD